MEVCGACGLIAPTERRSCDACDAPFATPRTQVPPLAEDAYWVSVRCEHRCRACGLPTPLNELDADGIVGCERCGIDQALDIREWADLFRHAHEVGDLAGPDPSGRKPATDADIGAQNYFKTTGVKHGAAPSADRGEGHAHVTAGPGHPLCKRCHVPLVVPIDAKVFRDCRATATCPSCNEAITYDLPKNARAAYPALRAVIAAGNRSDHGRAVVSGSPGQTIVLHCSNCSANLPAFDATRHVTCTFCKAVSFVPARASARHGGAAVPGEAWWLLFRGPSARRTALEDSVREHNRRAARQAERDKKTVARHEAKQQERAREEAAKAARDAAEAAEAAEEEQREIAERKRSDGRNKLAVLVALPLLFGGVIAAAIYGQHTREATRLENGGCNKYDRRPCYDGPAKTRGQGKCRDGEQLCEYLRGDWVWGRCTKQALPESRETCKNGLDDDCNGAIDDGCKPTR